MPSLVDAIHTTCTCLDLTGAHIKTKEDIEAAFHALNLCTHHGQKSDGAKGNKAEQSK